MGWTIAVVPFIKKAGKDEKEKVRHNELQRTLESC